MVCVDPSSFPGEDELLARSVSAGAGYILVAGASSPLAQAIGSIVAADDASTGGRERHDDVVELAEADFHQAPAERLRRHSPHGRLQARRLEKTLIGVDTMLAPQVGQRKAASL